MRLINTATLKFEEFIDHARTPPYAILSHTWEDGEVSFQEWNHHVTRIGKKGFRKIKSFCQLASQDGFTHAWVDTNCIDKRSSAELSEAINSMFAWYQEAAFCYVYMADVVVSRRTTGHRDLDSQFLNSKWFTRGWTLRELIAPRHINFYANDWGFIGTKQSLLEAIHRATGIDTKCLLGEASPSEFSIAKIMSWAAGRVTTRLEDQAYCLLGLFDVNMPLLYGEGGKAFIRLQEEIIRKTDDQSIFVYDMPTLCMTAPLATSPSLFANSTNVSRWFRLAAQMAMIPPFYTMTNAGLSISLPLIQTLSPNFVLGVLNCNTVEEYTSSSVCLPLSSHMGLHCRKYTRVSLPAPWISLSLPTASIKSLLPWYEENAARLDNWSSDFQPEKLTNIMISMLSQLDREILSRWVFGPSKQMTGKAAKVSCFITFPRGLSGYRLYAADPPEALDEQTSMMAMLDQKITDGNSRGLLVFEERGSRLGNGKYIGIYVETALDYKGALQDWPRACRILQNWDLGREYNGSDEDRGTG
ncbi:HET domain-containing protein [Colletotrichum fioriniae PJ7]|uniref:HET domain-containing protein n=1 Tax=Colletotrichum fioriniae PJ7 TaxID=1445577 RepID=A0A010RVL8_9PEZI|nr:HET domain-containing protein [Colletotrichum fioriniae PJ7]